MRRKKDLKSKTPPESSFLSGRLLSTPEVCKFLGVSKRTLLRMCERREINFIRLVGAFKFRPSAIELFVAQRENAPYPKKETTAGTGGVA